ncbi:MAG TPA: mechanosensitive ion channel family protein [Firmicutes bacterium]|nr:mechanosensitive ion channel family protein [Bacillota bacterium]
MHWSERLREVLSLEALLNFGFKLLPKLLAIIVIILLARLLLRLGYLLIERVIKKTRESKGHLEERKYETLQHLVKSLLRYLVVFVAAVTILDTVGVSVTSVLAGAGIAGLAVSFGAQNLVRDLITGFFIIFEDQYAVGEYISIGQFSGIVEDIGLRVTKLRAFAGDLHIIPNGNITQVTNYSRGNMRALVDIPIAYEEDIDKALAVLEETSRELAAQIPEIVEGPHVLGVVDLGNAGVVLRVIAMARPMYQWGVERQLRKEFKEALEKHGIEIPYPRQVVIMAGEAKEQ